MPAINLKNIELLEAIRKRMGVIVTLPMIILFSTCIEPFEPDIDKYESAIVIVGELVETDSIQQVEVSISSNYNDRKLLPVTGCVIYVEDDKGNVFNYFEIEDGKYICHIEPAYLNVGTSYRLVVNTSEGNTYASEFDKMLECPDIDSVYFAIEKAVLGVEQREVNGVQFYVTAKKEEGQAQYCRWALDETWEYRAYYENNAKVENGEMIRFNESVYVPICWMTKTITTVHTAQLETEIKPIEINYVSNLTPRLYYNYSLHIRQLGISEGAYAFWTALASQFEEAGELYEKQPQGINSNISNVNNAEELVLGYFNTATVKETRVFVKRDWDLFVKDYCDFDILPSDPEEWPPIAYLYVEDMVPDIIMSSDSACFDCTARGGTSVKPDFWED